MNKNAKGHGDFFIFKKVLWDLIESEESVSKDVQAQFGLSYEQASAAISGVDRH